MTQQLVAVTGATGQLGGRVPAVVRDPSRAPDATFVLAGQHHATEEHIRASGLRHTFLCDSMYLDLVPFLASSGVIAGPAGDGSVAVLLGEGHDSETYDVTGGRLRKLAELAPSCRRSRAGTSAMSTRRSSRRGSRVAHTVRPTGRSRGWITSYLPIAGGEMAVVSDTVARLTGHQPITLRELLARDPSLIGELRR